MLPFYKKYWRTFFDIGLVLLTVYLITLAFQGLYHIAAQLVFCLVIYAMIHPLAHFLHKKGVKKTIATTISTTVFLLIVFGTITLFGAIITTQVNSLAKAIPNYVKLFDGEFNQKVNDVEESINALPPEVIEKAKEYSTTILQKSGETAKRFLEGTFSALTSGFTWVLNSLIGLFLAYLLCLKSDDYRKSAREKVPKVFRKAFSFVKENVIEGISKYLLAQLKLIGCTFIILFVGLLIINVDNAFTIALIAGIFDLLPVLGVSTIFVPWIIYLFIAGSTAKAISITALWLIVMVFRQIAEPKIMGNSLGVSAFVMLSGMVVAVNVFGFAGIFLSPVLIILIKALYDEGHFKNWISIPDED